VDCTEQQLCLDGQCVEKVCTASLNLCKDNAVHTCNADGTASALVTACKTGEHCDGALAACVPNVCMPNAASCVEDVLQTCNAYGSGYLEGGTDCTASDEVCWQGECWAKVCDLDPGFSCKNGNPYHCSANGSKEELFDTCASHEYCNPTIGQCSGDACLAGAPVCDGELLTSCKPDGSGSLPGGVPCNQGSACYMGQCKSVICTASYACEANILYACRGNGTELSRSDTCNTGEYCDAAAGACKTKLCEAGQSTCNASVAATCNNDGSGFLPGGTDCAATGKACKSGACLPLICTPNAYFCQTDDVMRCGPEGASSQVFDDCSTGEFCEPGDSSCNFDVCTAASAICNGDLLTTCKANGSGPEAGGTDCAATGKVCDQAQCRVVVCEPNQYFCGGAGDVLLCNAKGWSSSLSDDCTTSEFCDSSVSPPACWYDVCTASAAACNGESLATCNADGSGFASTTTNCATGSKVCDLALGCVTSAVDTEPTTRHSRLGSSRRSSSSLAYRALRSLPGSYTARIRRQGRTPK